MLELGIPSKGRIHQPTLDLFANVDAAVKTGGSRSYSARIDGMADVRVSLLPPNEIAKRLHSGELHCGITGKDLIYEHGQVEDSILFLEAFDFGRADLIVAVPTAWIDVATMADLPEVFEGIRAKLKRSPRVATKYINVTRRKFAELGLNDFTIANSAGATEAAPANGEADIIVDITSTGATLRANQLKAIRPKLLESSVYAAASLNATWREADFAALERLIARVSASRSDKRFVRFAAPADAKALSSHLEETYGAPLAHIEPGGEAALYLPTKQALDAAADLQKRTERPVAVFQPEYVFEGRHAAVEALARALSKT